MMRLKQIIAVTLAMLLVLSALGNAAELVLCLAADGHARIEFASETGCATFLSAEDNTTKRVRQASIGLPDHSSHCGPCIDVPLGMGDPAKQPRLILQDFRPSTEAPLAVASTCALFPAKCVTQQRPLKAQCVDDTELTSLRAVVLVV